MMDHNCEKDHMPPCTYIFYSFNVLWTQLILCMAITDGNGKFL